MGLPLYFVSTVITLVSMLIYMITLDFGGTVILFDMKLFIVYCERILFKLLLYFYINNIFRKLYCTLF